MGKTERFANFSILNAEHLEGILMKSFRILSLLALLILAACAHHQRIPSETISTVYSTYADSDAPVYSYAPLFLAYNYRSSYNRMGQPSARYDDQGNEQIYIDNQKPVIFFLKKNFTTSKGRYTNLIYRIHFPKVPFRLIPFYLTAGKNVGLMVVITLDSQQKPVLVTTVHTCGCYLVIVPTSFLPRDALPAKWREKPIRAYGETLPWLLDYSKTQDPKLLIHLRPGVHRVMDLEIIGKQELQDFRRFNVIYADLKPARELEKIPLDGGHTSFYHRKGLLKGYVKGSVKPLESIFLSLVSLDFFVGTDKVYDDYHEYGNPFYTSLKPWNHNASDMRNFAAFLKFWGWQL
jgi:hypothetical protein